MKQISLFFLLLCLLATGASAATFSGTVTNASTSTPMASQKVYIQDSFGTSFWVDSTLTNTSGFYSFTLPGTIASGHYLVAYTRACGTTSYVSATYSGSNITGQNFSVCSTSSAYTLRGLISLNGSPSINRVAMAYLIRKQYDSLLADTTLIAIDSISVTGAGGGFSKGYSSIPYGTLLLKVALQPTDSQFANFLPTYHDSSLQWSGALALTTGAFSGGTAVVYMKAGSNPGGAGFIGGSVLLGANKSTGTGDPLSKRIIMITNAATGKAVGYTYSDAAGHFQFSNLATRHIQVVWRRMG